MTEQVWFMLLAFVLGGLGGWVLCYQRFAGLDFQRKPKKLPDQPRCVSYPCNSLRDIMCGCGHCTRHCKILCENNCTPPDLINRKVIEEIVVKTSSKSK